jgi:peroxiredoxin
MIERGDSAPDFRLETGDGTEFRLALSLEQGPVVLAFFKADCAACTLAFPYLEQLHQAYRSEPWAICGISQHPARAAAWFARTTGVTFPLLIDGDALPVSLLYDPPATPTIYLIDRGGVVRSMLLGAVKADLNRLAAQLADLLDKDPVVIAPPDDGKPSFRPG